MTDDNAYTAEPTHPRRPFAALLDASRRQVVSDPKEWTGHLNLGLGYQGTGKMVEAISAYQKALEISEGNPNAAAALAQAYARVGKRALAEKILADLEKSKSAHVSPYTLATIYASLGEKDKAFEFLERAVKERSLDITYHIKADLRIDSLRSDARFHDLMHRMDLPE